MSTFFKLGSLIEGTATTATSGGTTSLAASDRMIQVFTGTQTQTVNLPNATTLPANRYFMISNRSSGAVTVKDFGGTTLLVIAANSQKKFIVTDVSSSAGVWKLSGDAGSSGGGSASATASDKLKSLQSLANGQKYNDGIDSVKRVRVNPEEMGANVWVQKNSLGTAQARNSAMSFNGFLYNVAGQSNSIVERYDDTNNFWLVRSSITGSQGSGKPGCFDIGGIGYAAGGDNGTAVSSKYTDTTDVWATIASLPAALTDTSAYALNGFGYVPGGANSTNGTVQSSNYRYNATLDSWSTRGVLSTARYLHKAIALNGVGYAIAGENASFAAIATGEKYSDTNNSWSSIASVGTTSGHTGGFGMLGFAYVYQGATDFERYADFTNTWIVVAPSIFDHTTSGGGDVNGFGYQNGASAGSNGTRVDRYSASTFFSLGSFKKSSSLPTSMLSAVGLASLTPSVPVRVRSDGDTWRTFTANTDSSLKTGESISGKFIETALFYAAGGQSGGSALSSNEFYNQVANTWATRAALGTARYAPSSFRLGGFGYTVAGTTTTSNANNVATSERYDDISNTSVSRASITTARAFSAAVQTRGFGFVFGGQDTSSTILATAFKYTAGTDAWSSITSLTSARNSIGTVVLHDFGHLIGGFNGAGVTIHERYNAETNAYATRTSIPASVYLSANFTVADYFYMCGGYNGGQIATVRQYNDQADSFTSKTSLSTARYGAAQGMLDGFGYNSGGNNGASLTSSEKYNPFADTWSSAASLNAARDLPSSHGAGVYRNYEVQVGIPAFVAGTGAGVWITLTNLPISGTDNPGNGYVNGFAYSIGGRNGGSNIQSTQKFSEDTKAFTQSFDMASPAMGEVPCGTANGFIYNSKGGTTTNVSQRFDDQTGWISRASSSASLNSSTSATLNGLYYVTGGSGPTANVEQYTDATNSWATKTSMSLSRATHSTFNLNGFLYVASGNTNQAAEQYDDASNAWTTKATCGTSHDDAGTFTLAGFGWLGGNTSSTTVVEKYSDNANVWLAAPSLPSGGYGCATGAASGNSGFIFGHGPGTFNKCYQFSQSVNNFILGAALEVK